MNATKPENQVKHHQYGTGKIGFLSLPGYRVRSRIIKFLIILLSVVLGYYVTFVLLQRTTDDSTFRLNSQSEQNLLKP